MQAVQQLALCSGPLPTFCCSCRSLAMCPNISTISSLQSLTTTIQEGADRILGAQVTSCIPSEGQVNRQWFRACACTLVLVGQRVYCGYTKHARDRQCSSLIARGQVQRPPPEHVVIYQPLRDCLPVLGAVGQPHLGRSREGPQKGPSIPAALL